MLCHPMLPPGGGSTRAETLKLRRCAGFRLFLSAGLTRGSTSLSARRRGWPGQARPRGTNNSCNVERNARLEIEIGVVLGRRRAGDVIGEDLTKARPRLDSGIPLLGRRMRLPRHVAEIIKARQMRRRGDVG